MSEMDRAERLLAYALIIERPRYDQENGDRLPISDACVAAAEALRFYAEKIMEDKP